ncbi:hypothetical protein VPH35_117213 [Triticum aestivum]|uniref:Uncharacterized protein n=1 Tax=Aegilops tauschii subsp. strangulata TaxID=200361 RepID=A0A453P2N8_AEGTS
MVHCPLVVAAARTPSRIEGDSGTERLEQPQQWPWTAARCAQTEAASMSAVAAAARASRRRSLSAHVAPLSRSARTRSAPASMMAARSSSRCARRRRRPRRPPRPLAPLEPVGGDLECAVLELRVSEQRGARPPPHSQAE